jgi:hypothetical protein
MSLALCVARFRVAFGSASAAVAGLLSSCKAGLLIVTSANPLTCDIHPSPLGRFPLAGAIIEALHAGDD